MEHSIENLYTKTLIQKWKKLSDHELLADYIFEQCRKNIR